MSVQPKKCVLKNKPKTSGPKMDAQNVSVVKSKPGKHPKEKFYVLPAVLNHKMYMRKNNLR